MPADLDFDVDEFMAMTPKERVRLCLRLAERAEELAVKASPKHRRHYETIAEEWMRLAEEMKQMAERSQKTRSGR